MTVFQTACQWRGCLARVAFSFDRLSQVFVCRSPRRSTAWRWLVHRVSYDKGRPTVPTGFKAFFRSDDPYAGIKKDEQQHEAAHEGREGQTYQCFPEPNVQYMMSKVPTEL